MEPVAFVTLLIAVVTILVLAVSLIAVALVLSSASTRLGVVVAGLDSAPGAAGTPEAALEEINGELERGRASLAGLVEGAPGARSSEPPSGGPKPPGPGMHAAPTEELRREDVQREEAAEAGGFESHPDRLQPPGPGTAG